MDKHFGPTKDRHIYLSTSNQASPNDIQIVRSYLEKKGWIIIEHDGGHYNNQLLFETSMMLMIGYDTGYRVNRPVGRGQYKQLYDRESYDYMSNWMLTGYTIEGVPEFYPVNTNGVKDDTAYKRDYGHLYVDITRSKAIELQDYNKVEVKKKPAPRKKRAVSKLKSKAGHSNGMVMSDEDARQMRKNAEKWLLSDKTAEHDDWVENTYGENSKYKEKKRKLRLIRGI